MGLYSNDNFNSHAHVERDSKIDVTTASGNISTHTLTWSVTYYANLGFIDLWFQLTRSRGAWLCCNVKCNVNIFISTHTLTWSVTGVFEIFVKFFTNFNSHAHVERDKLAHFMTAKTKISTHTLTWSVTFCKWFNKWAIEFQLTRSRGAWQQNDS